MRKIMIILAGLAVTALGFWGYLKLSGSATIEPPAAVGTEPMELPTVADDAQRSGPTGLIGAQQANYITRDPETRQVTREFGFLRLMNPASPTARWQVEKPYIIFYESSYQYRIDADSGLFQIERTGDSIVPRDGRLEGNVTIRLQPRPGGRVAETTLLLDDLLFSSERTEFSTDGPVQVISDQVELSGRGLVLLLNALDEQIDYLHIPDLVSLRLKDFVQDQQPRSSQTPVGPDGPADSQADGEPSADALAGDAASDHRRRYQCVIDNNVVIRYGDQIVVGGVERINIHNILFSSQATDTLEPSTAPEAEPSQPTERLAAADVSETAADEPVDRDDSRDVIVTCNGGILIQPMNPQSTNASAAAMAVEMNGAPLRIEQVDPLHPDRTQPLVHCGLLHYDMNADVLNLSSGNVPGDILLVGGASSGGRIETQGPVIWDRRGNHARITGPGVVYLDGPDQDAPDAGQIAFAGHMELLFAESPSRTSGPHLSAINLTGGISADLERRGTLKTAAESAYLAFGPDNTVARAHLEGAVRFENADAQSPSTAAAHSAVFHFDDSQQLARADLTGDVRLAAESGQVHTEHAFIAFVTDEAGDIQPVRFETTSPATLQTARSDDTQPPARFEASAISYDMLTGSGRATGPVRFVFYQPADPSSDMPADYWPVEITADGDAEFIAGSDREIETILFNRNVSGTRTQPFAAFTQTDAFHCDTMIVDLGRDADGRLDIRHITLRDGEVYAESKRTHETLTLAHIELACQQIVYDRQADRIVAVGPGQIEVDNSKAEPTDAPEGIDLRGPGYARIQGFDRIEWTGQDNRIVADSDADVLELAYIPVVDGVPSRVIRAAGGRVEMDLASDSDGRGRLSRLVVKDRVFFEEPDAYLLEGFTLVYDADADGWLSITGTPERPCMVNGAQVPYIHYNLNTGQLETQLSAIPGAVTVP